MSNVLDPGRDARRQANRQAEELRKQKQKQALEKAEAAQEVAIAKSRATSPTMGRRSLISGVTGRKETLG